MTSISFLTSQLVSAVFGNSRRNPDLSATVLGLNTAQPQPVGPGQALAALKTAEKQRGQATAAIERRPDVRRDLRRFEEAVKAAKSPEELLKNREALKVLLTASGLEKQLDQRALIQRALTSRRSEPGTLINQLATSNLPLANLANRLKFDTEGLNIIQNPETLAAFRADYLDALRRKDLERLTPGIDAALQFQKKAASITRAVDVLADPVVREVVTGALSIPAEFAFQPIENQERIIERRLQISRLKDSDFVEQLTQRFLINKNGLGPTALLQA